MTSNSKLKMAQFSPDVQSSPHRVIFGGFVSNTMALQQAGWSLSAREDHYGSRIELTLYNAELKMYMYCHPVEHRYFDDAYMRRELTFYVKCIAPELRSRIVDADFINFRPIDATPVYVSVKERSIKDFNIFAPAQVRTEEIIIEPKDVEECLALIKKMQAPELAAIRKRNREREAMPGHTFHAQILSINK